MGQVISLHKGGQEIPLKLGRYRIDVLGGWGVDVGKFSISFLHTQSGVKVNCERAFWPVQSYAFDKRAKRIFNAVIPESGTYIVQFTNSESLTVTYTNSFFSFLSRDKIPIDKISFYIY